jgi:hypothetical protein
MVIFFRLKYFINQIEYFYSLIAVIYNLLYNLLYNLFSKVCK